MREPENSTNQDSDAVTTVAAEKKRRRPPGGKTLLRQLQLLESAGYLHFAQEQIQVAVSEERREEADVLIQQNRAAPPEISMPAMAPSKTRRGRRPGENGGERNSAILSAEISQEYLATGQQMRPPSGTGPQWQSLGPWTVPNGQTYGASRVNVSGRVSSVAIDPSNSSHILVGAANGGIWESFDQGASWNPRSDFAPTLAIGAVVFDPRNSSHVFAGLGEGNWWSWLGAGILHSTDGGTTWSMLCTNPFVGQGFYDLVIDPQDSLHMIAATTGGLYTSMDGGLNWTVRRTQRTWSVAFPSSLHGNARILAACVDGLYRSTDGGMTWTLVTLPGATAWFNRLAVAISPSNPNIAYAWGSQNSNPCLWRRSGGRWVAMNPPADVDVGQAWYDWFLAVSPDNASQIYIGAINAYRGDLSGSSFMWTNISSRATGDSIHPDQHAIAVQTANPNLIYIGNDGGLFRSPDRGTTWVHCNNGLVISEFEYLAQNHGASRWLISGTQDNGTERWTGSSIWEHVADGDGGDCAVNRTDPRTVFHTFYNMSLERSTSSGDWNSWSWRNLPLPAGEGSLFYPPVEASATNGDTVAMGGGALYISRDNGTNWDRLAFPNPGIASAMYIPNADIVYVGTSNGQVYKTQWSGSAWGTLTLLGSPRTAAYISDLFVDPGNLNRLWATYRTISGGRAFRSDDGGSTWSDCTTGLPGLPVNAIEVDSDNSNRIWVAMDLGVYQSLDCGATWADFSNGLPNAYVGDLAFHPHARVLRAGTRNRGIWQIPVDGWLTQPITGVQFTGTLGPNQTIKWFTFRWPATWHVVWTMMPTTVQNGTPSITWKVQVERASAEYVTYWLQVTNLTSVQVSFEGRYSILSRY